MANGELMANARWRMTNARWQIRTQKEEVSEEQEVSEKVAGSGVAGDGSVTEVPDVVAAARRHRKKLRTKPTRE